MDQVVSQALSTYDKIVGTKRERLVVATQPTTVASPAITARVPLAVAAAAITTDGKSLPSKGAVTPNGRRALLSTAE